MADAELPPPGMTWGDYVERWVTEHGGWVPLADALMHRAGAGVEIADDALTVERGLRRLARRGHKPGGQYGRWMLRYFGFTSPIASWVRWLGTYHTRFSDLPSSLRLEQLALWNRPPIAESPLVCWIYLGLAHAHHSRLELELCEHWLARAEKLAPSAGDAAEIEAALLRAEVAFEAGERTEAERRHRAVGERLDHVALPGQDADAYRARLEHHRAWHYTRPRAGEAIDIARARVHYAAIPDSPQPFVTFRRHLGLAYCAWQLGDPAEAARLARRAVDAAGDGGLVRMRVMALNMLSRVVPADEAAELHARARSMAVALEDEELLRRVGHSAPPPGPVSPGPRRPSR